MKSKIVQVLLFIYLLLPYYAISQTIKLNAGSAAVFLLSTQKENGAFGPFNKEFTDLAWTYPAVHALKLLNVRIPMADLCFKNGNQTWMEKASWPNGPFYWSFYQKAKLYQLYGNTAIAFEPDIKRGQAFTIKYEPRKGFTESRNYTKGLFFDMATLWYMCGAIKILSGKVYNPEYVNDYIIKRQAGNGGFADVIPSDSFPLNPSDNTHLIVTHNAVMALKSLGLVVPNREKCIAWIRSCQDIDGGFKYNPSSATYSNKQDIWYTWAAIQVLKELGSEPKDVKACLNWLNSLQNEDGGFGDRPGWNSRIYSTYYAVDAIDMLTGDARKGIVQKSVKKQPEDIIKEGVYSIFQAHQKSPAGGTGMVDSVAAMKLNLITVKSKEKDIDPILGLSKQTKENRIYAAKKGYQLEILESPENYSHRLHWATGLEADHISNFIIPANLSDSAAKKYENAYKAGKKGLPWQDFKKQVIAPIKSLNTLFYPELDYGIINAYMVYDEGLDGQDGYNAVPGAHFKHNDWVRHFPYKERWEGVLPIVADGDAHGDIVAWRSNLEEFRNVFIAKGYKLNDYVDASLNGRSVCVIHTPEGFTRYYGAKPAIAYLKKHIDEWKWWKG